MAWKECPSFSKKLSDAFCLNCKEHDWSKVGTTRLSHHSILFFKTRLFQFVSHCRSWHHLGKSFVYTREVFLGKVLNGNLDTRDEFLRQSEILFSRCSKHNSPTKDHQHKHVPRYKMRTAAEQEEIRKKTTSILEKTLAVLQLTALAQFGCGSEHFHKNSLKQTHKGNHYG